MNAPVDGYGPLVVLPILLAVLVGLVVTQIAMFATSVYLHRGITHRALAVHPVFAFGCRCLLWISTGMRPREWAAVHRRQTMLTDHVSEWAKPYGMRAQTVDGNDVLAVSTAAREAVDYVRRERKPFFLETYTYRLRGHMEPDDQAYVDPVELGAWRAKDPIIAFERVLRASGGLSSEELSVLRERTQRIVEEATEFALGSPYPGPSELTTHVYA